MNFKNIFNALIITSIFFWAEAREVRATITDIKQIRNILSNLNANYKGSYSFCDHIYFPKVSSSKISYARIRMYQESKWDHKPIVLTIKSPSSKVIYKEEYDSLKEAQTKIKSEFEYSFQFSRQGWEYSWKNCSLFVENIENMPDTMEVIAKTEQEIVNIFTLVKAQQIINTSVPIFYKDLIQN